MIADVFRVHHFPSDHELVLPTSGFIIGKTAHGPSVRSHAPTTVVVGDLQHDHSGRSESSGGECCWIITGGYKV